MKSEAQIEVMDDGSVRIGGSLTFDSAPEVYEELDERIRSASGQLTVNLAGVERVDSSGLALLLEWQAAAANRENSLQIHNAPDSLIKLAKLCEADKLLDLSERPS